jgi:adenine phosphoribosyltransferase
MEHLSEHDKISIIKGEKMAVKSIADLEKMLRTIPDFPKPGISFKDMTPILQNPEAFRYVIKSIAQEFRNKKIDIVASAESRGFILGAALAYELGAGFVPFRKPGKLPYKTLREEYMLEYGTDAFEIHVDGVKKGDNVLIVDDVLATGGTMKAAVNLVKRLHGNIVGIALLIELTGLNGKSKIADENVFSLIKL